MPPNAAKEVLREEKKSIRGSEVRMVERTDHNNASEFVLRGIGPNSPTCSNWTTWHVARNSQTRVREGGKRVEKRPLRREP
jgi:hypothetical protein